MSTEKNPAAGRARELIPWDVLRMLIERDPVVQRLAADERAMLEEDLRSMTSGDRDFTMEQCWFGIEERLRQQAYAEEFEPLAPEELAELERRADEADAHPETLITWEELRAKLGWPERPPRPLCELFQVVPPLTEVERRFLAGAARTPDEAEEAVQALAARVQKRPEGLQLTDEEADDLEALERAAVGEP